MSHTELNLGPITDIIEEARRPDLSLIERSALYGAMMAYVREIEEALADHYPDGMGYELGKLHSVAGNLGIALGFNIYPNDKAHRGTWTAIEQDWYVFETSVNLAGT